MTRDDLSMAFQTSVDLARANDALALMTARLATMTELVTQAADDLSRSRITAGGTVRFMEARIFRAAKKLCQALTVAGVTLPKDEPDLARMSEALTINYPEGDTA